MIASTSPAPSTACRLPKNLSIAVPPFCLGAACDPVPETSLCQPRGPDSTFVGVVVFGDLEAVLEHHGHLTEGEEEGEGGHTPHLDRQPQVKAHLLCLDQFVHHMIGDAEDRKEDPPVARQ